MSVLSFIEKVCVQDAVYWAYEGSDGFGGTEFADPVDIKVRWDSHTEVMAQNNGKEFVSNAQVLTPTDLLEQSVIKLGTVAELELAVLNGELNDYPADPRVLDGAFEIKRMDRHPLFRSATMDVFVAYL